MGATCVLCGIGEEERVQEKQQDIVDREADLASTQTMTLSSLGDERERVDLDQKVREKSFRTSSPIPAAKNQPAKDRKRVDWIKQSSGRGITAISLFELMTETSIPKGNTASAAPRVLSPKDQTLFEHWRKTISSISLFSPADDPAKRTNAKETSNTISERILLLQAPYSKPILTI